MFYNVPCFYICQRDQCTVQLTNDNTFIIHTTKKPTSSTHPFNTVTYPYSPTITSHPKLYYSLALVASTLVAPWPAHNNTALPNCLLKSTFSTSCVSSTSPH